MSFTIICMKILNKIKEHLSANKNRTSHNMTEQETKFDNIKITKDEKFISYFQKAQDSIREIIAICIEPFI